MKNIAITVDKNYSIHAAVMLYSLLFNNNAKDIHINIIVDFNNFFYKIPILYVLKRKKCSYTFYYLNEKKIGFTKNLLISHHISIATYFRLFLPSILNTIDKVLFLDCDMIVDGNIDELYMTNIVSHSLAAVTDNNEERIQALKLNNRYFNAGVMLLNLAYLRENKFESLFEDFITNHAEKIVFWDQDVLNATTHESMLPLNSKWNCLSYNYDKNIKPIIIHYAGYHKPWNGFSEHVLQDKYFYYLNSDSILKYMHTFYLTLFKFSTYLIKLFEK